MLLFKKNLNAAVAVAHFNPTGINRRARGLELYLI